MSESDNHILVTITKEDRDNYKRLDLFLSENLDNHSRSFLKNLFENGHITLASSSPIKSKVELKRMPQEGCIIKIIIPEALPSSAQPENIPLEIIYEDEHLVFINKPAGMVTHPAPGNYSGTLVNAILHHCPDIQKIGDTIRPGIVHRLDKGTSGIMVVAKNQKCHDGLSLLFANHDIERIYHAISIGAKVAASGTLKSLLGRHPQNRLKMAIDVKGGRKAITHYKVIEYFKNCSLLEIKLETGRTHQIRVHLSSLLKAAVLVDPTYGNPAEHLRRLDPKFRSVLKEYPHPLLHAKVLGLKHPITSEVLRFEVPYPDIFTKTLKCAQST